MAGAMSGWGGVKVPQFSLKVGNKLISACILQVPFIFSIYISQHSDRNCIGTVGTVTGRKCRGTQQSRDAKSLDTTVAERKSPDAHVGTQMSQDAMAVDSAERMRGEI
jgi:hypothetical protein